MDRSALDAATAANSAGAGLKAAKRSVERVGARRSHRTTRWPPATPRRAPPGRGAPSSARRSPAAGLPRAGATPPRRRAPASDSNGTLLPERRQLLEASPDPAQRPAVAEREEHRVVAGDRAHDLGPARAV